MKEIKNKESKLCFDAKVVRKLLKMNGEIKFCPYCGKPIVEKCECHKNIIIDIKPYRNTDGKTEPDRSVFVFKNNENFQADLAQLIEEATVKKAEQIPEPIEAELD